MYQSHVYLDVRVLVSREKKAFLQTESKERYTLDKVVAEKVYILAKALGCQNSENPVFEQQTTISSAPKELVLSGLSLKIAENGFLAIEFHRRKKQIRIEEIRIEEDTGRLTHSDGKTHMDYTYAGCPSVRIKTSADFELGEEAGLFLDELRRLIQYLQIISDMPIDSLIRCNAYAALSKYPEMPNYYVKLRNLNSFNFVRKAINAELSRQEDILTSGGVVVSESRLWNERQNYTESYKPRNAELPRHFQATKNPVFFDSNDFAEFAKSSNEVELPEARRQRLSQTYGLSKSRSGFICDEKERADFFEETVACGADPMDAAHWMSSELIRLIKRNNTTLFQSPLTPQRFTFILQQFSSKQIHSGIAKQLLLTVLETGIEPEVLIEKNRWTQISNEEELLPIIRQVIEENPVEAEKLRAGEMSPLEFLTGLVMRKTHGMAVPQTVKALLKKELDIRIVYVLSMGGAICGCRQKDGTVCSGEESVLRDMLSKGDPDVKYQVVAVEHILSEEIAPDDWAHIITEVANRIAAGTATGIIIAHGTATLSYTAALLFWLFSDSGVPVVITASSTTPDKSSESSINLHLATEIACRENNGVYVVYGGKVLSPLNLKFERPTPDGFVNWNMPTPVFENSGSIATQFSGFIDLDTFVIKQILQEAANKMMVCRVYPGLNAEHYLTLVKEGINRIFLELYETGTGSMRNGNYSLKPLLIKGKKQGCRFYCTSQQQCSTDFSEYTTSRRVWREGAVPMGRLTTESAIALYFAAIIICDTVEELDQCMEVYADAWS